MSFYNKPSIRSYLAGSVVAIAALVSSNSPASACGPDSYIGTVCAFANTFCPSGYLPADGRTLQIRGNEALYSLIGPNYGGDGKTTFALPDLRGRVVVGAGIATSGGSGYGQTSTVSLGQKRGYEATTLTIPQMPLHTHAATLSGAKIDVTMQASTGSVSATPNTTDKYIGKGLYGGDDVYIWDNTLNNPVNVGGISGTLNASGMAIGNTGGNSSVAILPPELGLNYCIVNNGLYPERP